MHHHYLFHNLVDLVDLQNTTKMVYLLLENLEYIVHNLLKDYKGHKMYNLVVHHMGDHHTNMQKIKKNKQTFSNRCVMSVDFCEYKFLHASVRVCTG